MALKVNKLDERDTRMQMALHLFEPIRVYLSLLQWPKAAPPGSQGVTWLELLLDFWCSTRVEMKPMGCRKPGDLRAQAELFRAASRRVAQICKGRITRTAQTHKATSPYELGQEWTPGFAARSRLLFPDLVEKLLRAIQRHACGTDPVVPFWELELIPRLDLPVPVWTVDARYDILTGGTRPGGALNILWAKVHGGVD